MPPRSNCSIQCSSPILYLSDFVLLAQPKRPARKQVSEIARYVPPSRRSNADARRSNEPSPRSPTGAPPSSPTSLAHSEQATSTPSRRARPERGVYVPPSRRSSTPDAAVAPSGEPLAPSSPTITPASASAVSPTAVPTALESPSAVYTPLTPTSTQPDCSQSLTPTAITTTAAAASSPLSTLSDDSPSRTPSHDEVPTASSLTASISPSCITASSNAGAIVTSIDSQHDYVGQDHIFELYGFPSTTKTAEIEAFLQQEKAHAVTTAGISDALSFRLRWLNDNAVLVISNSITIGTLGTSSAWQLRSTHSRCRSNLGAAYTRQEL